MSIFSIAFRLSSIDVKAFPVIPLGLWKRDWNLTHALFTPGYQVFLLPEMDYPRVSRFAAGGQKERGLIWDEVDPLEERKNFFSRAGGRRVKSLGTRLGYITKAYTIT